MLKITPYFFLFCCNFIVAHLHAQHENSPVLKSNFVSNEISNLHIVDIAQDKLGYMWIATSRGLNKYNGYEYTHYLRNDNDTCSLDNDMIGNLLVTQTGELYILTRWGLNRYNRGKDNFTRILENNQYKIFNFKDDNKGTIWIGTNNGLAYLDEKNKRLNFINNLSLKHEIQNLCVDKSGLLWLNSNGKLLIYNSQTNKLLSKSIAEGLVIKNAMSNADENTIACVTDKGLVFFDTETFKIQTQKYNVDDIKDIVFVGNNSKFFILTSDLKVYMYNNESNRFEFKFINNIGNLYDITSIFIDRNSNTWVGTFNAGCKFYPHYERNFNVDTPLSSYFKNKFVTSISGNDDFLWIATSRFGLFQYDKQSSRISNLMPNPPTAKSMYAGIESCFYDTQKRLWVSSSHTPLACYRVENGFSLIEKYNEYRSGNKFLEDKDGNLWVTTSFEGLIMLPQKNKDLGFISMYNSPKGNCNARDVIQLHNGKFVFNVYGDGVYVLEKIGNKPHILIVGDEKSNLLLKSVISLYEDSKGEIWLGSYGQGVMRYNPKTKKSIIYTISQGLPSNDVLSIIEDNKLRIWMSTSFGLVKFTDDKGLINYQMKDGLLGNQYHQNSVYHDNRGILYFTGNHGITSLYPEEIKELTAPLPIVIETLKTTDKTFVIDDMMGNETTKVTLNHKQKSFTISFFGLDFYSANNLQYSYKLVGHENNWSYPGSARQANFTSIPAGDYIFKLKVRDGEGNWIESANELYIVVRPAPWLSGWALSVYFILIALASYFLISAYIKFKLNAARVKIAEENLVKENELNQAKIDFFMNISHELRTPLSLIYAPFLELSKRIVADTEMRYMSLIKANVERLMTLVDQLLNFTHLNVETLPFVVTEVDVISSVANKVERFREIADEKRISYNFYSSVESFKMLADEDKIDKILSNILSNAFKYTTTNGKIEVKIEIISQSDFDKTYAQPSNDSSVNYLKISVTDNGVGVMEEETSKVFERFYRSKAANSTSMVTGNGIGLYYTKCLVEKHKGQIKADINPTGGMTFHFSLPIDTGIFRNDENSIDLELKKIETSMPDTIDVDLGAGHEKKAENKPRLLIVEDEPKMQQFLELLLSPHYTLDKAYDGSEGLRIALQTIPDIILSDVMLPLMNGFEVCDKLKNDPHTCHIPIVMLSAKSGMDDHICGVNAGADVYIPKPFNPDYLISVLQGVLRNRQRIQQLFAEGGTTNESSEKALVQLSEMDKELLQKLNAQIDENIDNCEMMIDDLAAELNFSRSKFYRKLKSITGLSPNDYLKVYRIKKSAILIETDKYTFSEIADMTGFNTHSHFSASFKIHFGITPSEYKRNLS